VAAPGAPEFRPSAILDVLRRHSVDFVLIGGLAGMSHGSTLPSFDVDIAYAQDSENLERLVSALRELDARLRGAQGDLPLQLEPKTLSSGAMFTFETDYGSFDILSDPDGAPRYEALKAAAVEIEVDDVPVRAASLDHLIAMKEATGRPKDKLAALEYRAPSDELRAPRAES
jgi:hypothetical protein